jgi:hypothetical protein
MDDDARGKRRRSSLAGRALERASTGVRWTAVAAVVLAALFLVWLLFVQGGDGGSSGGQAQAEGGSVTLVSEADLLPALKDVGYPVYWAGPRPGVEYEVSRQPEGRTYIRYLPVGEEVESARPFLTIGSYRQQEPLAGLEALGRRQGAILLEIPGGGSAYAEGPSATSAYMAFPDAETQVEVYDPHAGRALRLVRSGEIVPVG